MNLRTYKSISDFKGTDPWMFPATKVFKAVDEDKTQLYKKEPSNTKMPFISPKNQENSRYRVQTK